MLAVEMVNPGAGNGRGSWGVERKGMRAVGDTQHCLPGQSAVQALIFADIYTLLSHFSSLQQNWGEPRSCGTKCNAEREGENRLEDALGMKQPPVQLGLCWFCCSVPMATVLLLSAFVTPSNLWGQCLSQERPRCPGWGLRGRTARPLFRVWVQRTAVRMRGLKIAIGIRP